MNLSQFLGRYTEYRVFSMLLDEQRELYLPVVDDRGIDLIVRTRDRSAGNGLMPEHYEFQELQIKSASTDGLFVFPCFPRPNYWFVFYIHSSGLTWLISSMDIPTIASVNTKGKHLGKYTLNLRPTKKTPVKFPQYSISKFSKLP